MDDDICDQCSHDDGDHLMMATGEEPMNGGVRLCPVKDCRCYATWAVPPHSSKETVRVPDQAELENLHKMAWSLPEKWTPPDDARPSTPGPM